MIVQYQNGHNYKLLLCNPGEMQINIMQETSEWVS